MLELPTPLSQIYHSYYEPLYSPDLILNDNQRSVKWPRTIVEKDLNFLELWSRTALKLF